MITYVYMLSLGCSTKTCFFRRKNKLAKAQKTRKLPGTLGSKKFGPGKASPTEKVAHSISAATGNMQHCTLLTPAVQKYYGCTKVILIGAQRLSCGSQRLSCGAQGYPAVHNGYPGRTWVGARDTCVSKKWIYISAL